MAPERSEAPLLALETSAAPGSVAVGSGPELLAESELGDPFRHASTLLPAAKEVLARAELRPSDLGGVVVGAGPGSFTGVRVAAATAKGIAHGLGIPLRAYSSLMAAGIGSGEGTDGTPVRCVLFDARGDRVYAAVYRLGRDFPVTLSAPRATTIQSLLDDGLPPEPELVGSGALRHRAELVARGWRVLEPPEGVPTARALLALAAADPEPRPVPDLANWEPEYLRPSGAERRR